MRTSSASRITVLLFALVLMISCTSASTVSKDGKAPEVEPKIYSLGYEKVYSGAIQAVSALEWQISFADKSLGIISAKTPTSLWTRGDELTIKVNQPQNDKVRVDVSSGTSRQMLDWGKNKGNIKDFYEQPDQVLLK